MVRLRHLVVVVPGIGGSVLRTADDRAGGGWDLNPRGVGRVLVDPGRLDLDEHPDLRPVGLVGDLTAVPGVTVVPGYAGLVSRLTTRFGATCATVGPDAPPRRDADVLLFPYDFRRGVAHAAERLAATVRAVLGEPVASTRPVLIVAHSMGGLVARYWLGALEGWRWCRTLVTLGTPHRGAPKALDWLVNGARLGPVRLARATGVLRGWPAVYDLVPRYPAVYDAGAGCPVRPAELPKSCVYADGPFARSAGAVLPGVRASEQMHRDLAAGWGEIPPDAVPAMHAVFARGHATVVGAHLRDGRLHPLRGTDPPWLPADGWPAGDGTVPAVSATPVELADDVRCRVPVWDRHAPMGNSDAVETLLDEYAAGSTRAIRGDDDRPGLGLDLDEFVPAGRPVPVSAVLHHAEADDRTRLRLRLRPIDPPGAPTRWADHPLDPSGDRWAATLPPLAPGAYEVRVEALNPPRGDVPAVRDHIEVLAR